MIFPSEKPKKNLEKQGFFCVPLIAGVLRNIGDTS